LERAYNPPRKYEEYAYVLDFNARGKSTTVRGREGIIITAREKFFWINHSIAALLFEYGKLETKTEKFSLDLNPSPYFNLRFEMLDRLSFVI